MERTIINRKSSNILYVTKIFLFLFNLIISVVMSEKLTGSFEIGGAIFIALRIFVTYIRLYFKKRILALPKKVRRKGYLIFASSIILTFFLIFIYPIAFNISNMAILISYAVLMFIWSIGIYSKAIEGKKKTTIFYFLLILAVVILSYFTKDLSIRIIMLFGAIVSNILTVYVYKNDEFINSNYSKDDIKKARELLEINSYNRLIKVIINVLSAVLIILIVTAFYMLNSSEIGVKSSIYVILGVSLIIVLITTITKKIFDRLNLVDVDANTILLLGAFLFIFACFSIYRYLGKDFTYFTYIFIFQGVLGISLMLAAIINLNDSVEKVIYFEKGKIEEEVIKLNQKIIMEWSLLISLTIILFIMTIVNYLNQFEIDYVKISWERVMVRRISFIITPSFFILLAIINTLRQPYTKEYVQKLNRYFYLREKGEDKKALRKRLKRVLVGRYTRKYGIKIIAAILKPFCFHKVINKSVVSNNKEPKIFVCNHGSIYGPIIANLYVPFYFRPWVISHLFDSKDFFDYVYNATIKQIKWIPKFLKKPLCKMLSKIVPWAMKSLLAIPVYRNSTRKIMKTFDLSVKALNEEDNILIFPENPKKTGGYTTEGVGSFYSGFSHLAIKYYKSTKKSIEFYPVFASKKSRIIIFGNPVRYNSENTNAVERKRISENLEKEMKRLKEKVE